jgi:DNA-binding PucR family transcriptional regulator
VAPTVGWLLTRPDLGLRLVAGHAGAEREIRWVHATELENPGPWMSGGELVLTTGLRLPPTVQRRRAYVEHLDEAGAAGIGFGIELSHPRVPRDILAAADERGLAVLEVPFATPFLALSRAVTERLGTERLDEVRRTVAVQARLVKATVDRGVGGVVRDLARHLDGRVAVLDPGLAVLAAEPQDASALVARVEHQIATARLRGRFGLAVSDGAGRLTVQTLAAANTRRGYLAVATGRALEPLEQLLVSQAASLVALELERPRDMRTRDREIRATLLDLAVRGALSGDALARHVGPLGFGARDPVAAAVVSSTLPQLRAQEIVDETLTVAGLPFLLDGGSDEVVVVTTGPARLRAARDVAAAARAAGAAAVAVGVGTTQDWDGIAKSLRQARYALRLARTRRAELVEFADLGVVDLLFGAQESAALADLSAHVLGPLERYDREHDGELVRSLAEFLTHNGHWEAAAARLGVHRHSLRYRVRKIEQLTDRSLDSAHDRTEFLLALAARDLAGPAEA